MHLLWTTLENRRNQTRDNRLPLSTAPVKLCSSRLRRCNRVHHRGILQETQPSAPSLQSSAPASCHCSWTMNTISHIQNYLGWLYHMTDTGYAICKLKRTIHINIFWITKCAVTCKQREGMDKGGCLMLSVGLYQLSLTLESEVGSVI